MPLISVGTDCVDVRPRSSKTAPEGVTLLGGIKAQTRHCSSPT